MSEMSMIRLEKDFVKTTLRIAIPVMIQSLVAALMHIVDNVMIGQLGEAEIAAVTQANRVSFLFQLCIFGLSGATSVFCAQYWGQKNMKGIRQTMGMSLVICLFISIVFITLCQSMPHAIMSCFLTEENVIQLSMQYLTIVSIGYLCQGISVTLGAVQRSTEQVRLAVLASVIAIVTNTVLNYILIFGNFGAPKLGVRGAAIATVIGCTIETLIIVLGGYMLKLATAAKLKELVPESKAQVLRYIKIATPIICNEMFWSFGVMLYSVVYGRIGTGAVAAVSIFNNVEQLSSVVMRGMTQSCAVLVGKAIGEGKYDNAYGYAKRFMFYGSILAILAGIVLICISGGVVGLFNVSDAVKYSARMMIIFNGCALFVNMLNTLYIVGIFRAGGDAKFSLIVDVGSVWVIGLPLIAITGLVFKWDVQFVYSMTIVENIVKAIVCTYRFRSRKWINNLVG